MKKAVKLINLVSVGSITLGLLVPVTTVSASTMPASDNKTAVQKN